MTQYAISEYKRGYKDGKTDAAAEIKELLNHIFELSFALDSQSAGRDFLSLRRTHYNNLNWIHENGLTDEYYKYFFEKIKGGAE